ncbi:MAG TPA: ABC-F family ATP-binding cassette domain-containing protein, partial [Anaeromyxobacteraceae bacterium]|nr:ABC-F family ATP-binding cassette domain-containing protein [Anaeromyxobacteraceae bacterium]
MSLVTANGLSLAFGPKVLFAEAGFTVATGDRIGLIGANGSGKSSILRILAGEASADQGTLAWRRGARAGYLPQEVAAPGGGPLLETVLASVPGRGEVEARLAATEAALGEARSPEEQLELSQALADLHAELDHFEERHGRHLAERILGGLGFAQADLDRDLATFSGGWQMRAALAGILLQDPDLLLLDEPTNHLDVPALAWFDGFLRGTRKALLLVSHDREFLNRQIDRVLSLEPEGLRAYAGDYDAYLRQRAEEREQQRSKARRVEARRAELQGFIDRFGAKATKARQAQSRQKMLDRLEEVALYEERATLSFSFAPAPRSGREVLKLEGVSKAFGERAVYRDLSAQVLRGERIAVIGPNGAGKTTLLRLVAGELAPDAGAVKLGHGVLPGYYAQHHVLPERGPLAAPAGAVLDPGRYAALDPRATILEALWSVVPEVGEAFVRSVAGGFLFSGGDVDKPIGVLSGGERARVALARILLLRSNFLLLDEPTNHLDLASSEALIEALKGYAGTMLFVSHNRSFLNGLATRIWEVKDGGLVDQPGNLDDWLYHQREMKALEPEAAPPERAGPDRENPRERRRAEAELRNARARREKPVRE